MDRANGKDRLKAVASAARSGGGVRIGGGEATGPAARATARPPAVADALVVAPEDGLGLSGDVLPLAAERPDAAQRGWDMALRAAAHAVVLLCVVGFVFVYCVWSPLAARLRGAAERATVVVLVDAPVEVRAPDVTGVFRAERPLASGQTVRRGQILGRIESPGLEAQWERALAELAALQVQRLRIEDAARADATGAAATAATAAELASLDARLAAASDGVARLERLKERLLVRAPCDGALQQGLASTVDVTAGSRLTVIVPRGANAHVEVTAPLQVLNELQRRGSVVAEFTTPDGTVNTSAVPVRGSVRPFLRDGAGPDQEIWGVMRCTPLPEAEAALVPGTIGRLCW